MADAGGKGGSVRDRSGLGQAEIGVQARARMRRATAGKRHWRLSRAGLNFGSGSDGGGRGWNSGLRWEGECEVAKWTTPSQV